MKSRWKQSCEIAGHRLVTRKIHPDGVQMEIWAPDGFRYTKTVPGPTRAECRRQHQNCIRMIYAGELDVLLADGGWETTDLAADDIADMFPMATREVLPPPGVVKEMAEVIEKHKKTAKVGGSVEASNQVAPEMFADPQSDEDPEAEVEEFIDDSVLADAIFAYGADGNEVPFTPIPLEGEEEE